MTTYSHNQEVKYLVPCIDNLLFLVPVMRGMTPVKYKIYLDKFILISNKITDLKFRS